MVQTRGIYAGERVPPVDFAPVATPIWPTVGYPYESMDDLDAVFAGRKRGHVYLRYSNPIVEAFENAVADLEKSDAAQAYGSGMAAIRGSLLAAGAKAGASVVAALDVYRATYSLLRSLFKSLGAEIRMVNVSDHAEVEPALQETKAIVLYFESISTPLLKVADIPTLASLAHCHGASLLVDNTLASPYLLNPIRYAAHFVIHSATKFLSGHEDVLAGIVATSQENKSKRFELNKLVGGD